MKAMVLEKLTAVSEESEPLVLRELPAPIPKKGEILVRISRCSVCHTELDEIEGRTPPSEFPMIPGHQIIGYVEELGPGATQFRLGDRVGIGWIYSSCGHCSFCVSGQENLCLEFKATGRDANGGYAQFVAIDENFAFLIPPSFSDSEAAPLLCAGAIGFRSLRLTNLQDGQNLGLAGFGASAHIVLKLARFLYPNSNLFVFSRSEQEQQFAIELGATWSGSFTDTPPEAIHAIIDTTPAWLPVLVSLQNLGSGGRLVINAIRKEDNDKHLLASLDYPAQLWLEKEIKSVANVCRADIKDFLELASQIPILPIFQEYKLENANQALYELKNRKIRGAKVLII